MRPNDRFQMERAQAAFREMNSPEWAEYERQDGARREALTLAQGHSPKCGILNCHPECKRPRPSWQKSPR